MLPNWRILESLAQLQYLGNGENGTITKKTRFFQIIKIYLYTIIDGLYEK
jgi:hypothetical protein